MSNKTTNLAAVLLAADTPLVLQERPVPTPQPDELLIRVHAIGLNPIDHKRQTGFMVRSYPTILGSDISGIVIETGSSVTSFQPGDRVFAAANTHDGNLDHGGFQTYITAKAITASHLPGTLSFKQGATLPVVFGTATIALFDVLGLPLPPASTPKGILVWGGASQAGAAIIQLARLAGLTVFATASTRHHGRVRALGAVEVVDYRSPTAVEDIVAAAGRAGVDIAYAVDVVGSVETLPRVVEVLRAFEGTGKVGTLVPWPQDQLPLPKGVEHQFVMGSQIWGPRVDLAEWLYGGRLTGWLETGEVVSGVCRMVEGGLGGLQDGLEKLKKGVSGEKLVVEV